MSGKVCRRAFARAGTLSHTFVILLTYFFRRHTFDILLSPWQRPRHIVRFREHDRDDWPYGFHFLESYRNGHGLGLLAVEFLK